MTAKTGLGGTAIIITPHFSPSPLAGIHRARHLAKHLPAFGWRPIVLHPASRHYGHRLDPSLLTLTPPETELVSVDAVSERLTRPFGLGDISLRSFAQMASALDRASRVEGPKVVLITAAPFYSMLLVGRAKRLGMPVVLDFQDPWVSAYGATRPALSKEGLSHRLAHWLEPKVVRQAALLLKGLKLHTAYERAIITTVKRKHSSSYISSSSDIPLREE